MDNDLKLKKNILFVILITSFITTFMGSALNLSIPQIENDFNAGAAQVGWVITAYMLTCASLAVPFGKMADSLSLKTVLCIGLFVFLAGSVLGCFSVNIAFLIPSRIVQGIGGAMIFSSNLPLLVRLAEEDNRGKLIGYVTAANYVGLSLGPVAGGFLNDYFGWESIFVASSFIVLVALCMGIKSLPSFENGEKNPLRDKLSFSETSLYILSLCLLMYGLSSLGSRGVSYLWLISGLILFVFFIRMELESNRPLLDIRRFVSNKAYFFANIGAMLNYGSIFATTYLLSLFLQYAKSLSAREAGLVLVVAPVIQSILSPVAGKIVDKYSPVSVSAAGAFVCSLAALMLCFIEAGSSIFHVITALALEGIGCALFSSPNSTVIIRLSDDKDYGVASSILATMRSMGHTITMAVVTVITGFYIGGGKLMDSPVEEVVRIIQVCFYVITAISIIGFFMVKKHKS